MPAVSLLTPSGVKPNPPGFVVMLVVDGTSTCEGLSFGLKCSSSLNACLALFYSSIELQGPDNNSSISYLKYSGVL